MAGNGDAFAVDRERCSVAITGAIESQPNIRVRRQEVLSLDRSGYDLLVIATGLDPLRILLLSQAALSFTLPFALIPLLILTQRTRVMDRMVNGLIKL